MTTEELKTLFEKHADDYLEWEEVPEKYRVASRRDLCAFILLDKLVSRAGESPRDIVSCAEHDEIWLSVSPDELADSAITEEDIKALSQLGVLVDSDLDCFRMRV